MGGIAMRYLDCPEGSFPWKIRQLLEHGSTAIDPAVAQTWHDLIGDSPPCFSREIQRAAFAILGMGLRGEREGLPSMLATSFAEAAGVAGRPKWGLVLSSSARVSQVTYQTVVGVRYPELVTFNGTSWNFGKFVTHERPQRGGFLPIFWDVPRADTHAVEDIGAVVDWLTERCDFHADAKSSLAVLHNRNDMTNLFRASNWVSESQDSIVSRGVTTCAGMTAHTVILAQTSPPPPAIVEVLQDYVTNYHKVRRLHLIVVDLWRPWKYNTARAREITDQLWRISDCDATRRVSPFRPDGPEPPLRCRRFAYGYALDGSEFPCFLVWPQRDGQSYVLLDTATADTLVLDQSFFRPLGMQHFYDSFALVSQICVRRDALTLFGLNDDELLPDLHITGAGVLRTGLGAHQEHLVNQDAQVADRKKVPAEVIQVASHEVDTDSDKAESIVATSGSEGSESASDSEQNDPPSSLASDAEQYERMQASYVTVGRDFQDQEDFIGSEYRKLQRLELVPERWPLARLSFSLQKCVDHLDRVLAGAGGRLWPQFLVACDRNFWSLVTAWTVTVSLFAAGTIFGHVGASLLVASALFGDVGGSIFLAGAAFGEIWHSTGVVLCSMEFVVQSSME